MGEQQYSDPVKDIKPTKELDFTRLQPTSPGQTELPKPREHQPASKEEAEGILRDLGWTAEELIDLQDVVDQLARSGADNVWVFGSMARGKENGKENARQSLLEFAASGRRKLANSASDIDLVAERTDEETPFAEREIVGRKSQRPIHIDITPIGYYGNLAISTEPADAQIQRRAASKMADRIQIYERKWTTPSPKPSDPT